MNYLRLGLGNLWVIVSQPSDAGVSKSKDASENLKSTYSVKLKHNFNIKLIATVYAFTLLRDVLNIRKFTDSLKNQLEQKIF
jgi:hypothetical protein